jgi:hypothetical protein
MARTRRPDLEALEFQKPKSIADIIAPPAWKTKKVGVLYYADILADSAAQTNRALGAAATRVNIAPVNVAHILAECVKGFTVDNTSLPEAEGGVETWRRRKALAGKRSVATTVESRVADGIFGKVGDGITAVPLGANILLDVQNIRTTIENFGTVGKVVLFGARKTMLQLRHMEEVIERMVFTGIIPKDARGVRSISWETLAEIFDVDMVIEGPNAAWLGAADAYDGYLGVALVPDAQADPDEYPQLARNLCYDWIGQGNGEPNAFCVETFPIDEKNVEALDVTALTQLHLLNPELCQVITGVGVEEST